MNYNRMTVNLTRRVITVDNMKEFNLIQFQLSFIHMKSQQPLPPNTL